MPTFQITAPDGKKYRVTGETAEGAYEALTQHLGQTQSATTEPVDAPWYQDAAQAADDTARLLANGLTFGYADKLAGYLGGAGTEAERALTAEASERAGSAGTAAELLGAVATPVGLAGKGLTLAGRAGTGALQGLPGLGARTGLMAAEGAGYGALTAMGNDQDIKEGAVLGAIGGGAGNVAGEALSAGVGKAASLFNKKPQIPALDDIEAAAQAARRQADEAGVAYTPQAVDRLATNMRKSLTDIGYHPRTMPGASAAVDEILALQGQNVTLTGLDTIRKIASGGYIPGNKQNNLAVTKIIQSIDDMADSLREGDVLMGDGAAGAQALKEARRLESRMFKAAKIDDAVNKADLRSSSTGSGGNVDNATRQNLRRILENPRGLTPDEREALEAVVRGTPTQNGLRLAGKLSPSGNGLMAALGVGGAMVNPMIGALSLGGMGAKALADRSTQQNVQKLVDIILAGGQRSAAEAAPNALQRLAGSERERIARILMGIGAHEAGTPAR